MKSICTCWLDATRCESGKNHQDTWLDALSSHIVWTWVKLQHKVSENDSDGRPASLLLWAYMSLNHQEKAGKKNLPSYDRKTRASRAKKLGIWPKRAPTMWAPRTLLWWPPCDLGHWSYEPRCRSLHAAGHGHSHGHRNLSSQTHCTTPAARAQHTFSNWVFVALLPLHTSCQIHP